MWYNDKNTSENLKKQEIIWSGRVLVQNFQLIVLNSNISGFNLLPAWLQSKWSRVNISKRTGRSITWNEANPLDQSGSPRSASRSVGADFYVNFLTSKHLVCK